jgi:hypothetical protein
MLLQLLIAATVGVHVEVAESVDEPATRTLAELLAEQIHARTQRPVVAIPRPPEACGGPRDVCLEALRTRAGADELVVVRVFGGATRIGLFAERLAGSGQPARADLDALPAAWPPKLAEVAAALFPEVVPPAATAALPSSRVAPAILIGSAAAAGIAAGIVFAVSEKTLSDVTGALGQNDATGHINGISYSETERRYQTISSERTAAFAGGAAAVALAIVGAVLLIRF